MEQGGAEAHLRAAGGAFHFGLLVGGLGPGAQQGQLGAQAPGAGREGGERVTMGVHRGRLGDVHRRIQGAAQEAVVGRRSEIHPVAGAGQLLAGIGPGNGH